MTTSTEESVEREFKFSLDGLGPMRDRLIDLEAERLSGPALEDNWVLDREGELEVDGRLLRLRKDGKGASMAFKGPATWEGGMKVRVENETRIEDLEQARHLFKNLGFHSVRRYQKVREEWQLGAVTIALDHTVIGDFVEFEGTGAETVARRCGFSPKDGERQSYLGIYDEHRKKNPDLPRDMLLP